MDRYVVIGNPVEHSMSPRIHARFARDAGQAMTYDKLLAPLGDFPGTASAFFSGGGRGANVTVPFKADAAAWVDVLDPLAAAAGAVNTILCSSDGRHLGFNTDGIGLVRDLERNLAFPLSGRRILIIGAGGAASGAVGPLLAAGPRELVLANRTLERAQAVAARFAGSAAGPVAVPIDALTGIFDLVINATSAGLAGDVPEIAPAIVRGAYCYDMVYGHRTPFSVWAIDAGAAAAVDGLGMLVEQAAEAFRIWRGILPETAALIAELRSEQRAGGR